MPTLVGPLLSFPRKVAAAVVISRCPRPLYRIRSGRSFPSRFTLPSQFAYFGARAFCLPLALDLCPRTASFCACRFEFFRMVQYNIP